jgi:hypothetical protein
MPGASHEILIMALRERPDLLAALVERLTGRPSPGPLSATDSALRFADVKEVRPDLVLRAPGLPWVVVEVQHKADEAKRRRWPLAAGVLLDEHGAMGELVVLTARRSVARWASGAITWAGRWGTRLSLDPIVLLIDLDAAERLLAGGGPEFALVAAWSLGHKVGPRSQRLARRALKQTMKLPAPERFQQGRAILQLLSPPLRKQLQAMFLKDLDKLPQPKSYKEFVRALEARGEARGEAKALLKYLDGRGVVLAPEQRAAIEGCADAALLDRWLERAFTATTNEAIVEALFGRGR